MKIAKLATQVKSSGDGLFTGIANSLTMTRSGITVTESAGKSVVGKTVPLLLSHDWDKPSIGSVTMTNVDEEGLHYKAELFKNAPDRDLLLEGIEAGTNYVSIGFAFDNIDTDGNIDSIDLLELSLTSTPADAKATAEVIKQALKETKMAEDPQNSQSEEATVQDVLDAVAAFKSDVDKSLKAISDAVVPADGDKSNPEANKDNPADDTEKQALEEKNAQLMSFMDKIDVQSLTFDEYMAFKDLQK